MVNVNTKCTEKEKNLGGRPSGRTQDTHFHMRVNDEFLRGIDDWRRKQEDLPNRAEAIRRLVKIAIKRDK